MGIRINAKLTSYARACADAAWEEARKQGFSSTPISTFRRAAIQWVKDLSEGIIFSGVTTDECGEYFVEAATVSRTGIPSGISLRTISMPPSGIPIVEVAEPRGRGGYVLSYVLRYKFLERFCRLAILTLICGYTLDHLFLNGRLLNGICHLFSDANEQKNVA